MSPPSDSVTTRASTAAGEAAESAEATTITALRPELLALQNQVAATAPAPAAAIDPAELASLVIALQAQVAVNTPTPAAVIDLATAIDQAAGANSGTTIDSPLVAPLRGGVLSKALVFCSGGLANTPLAILKPFSINGCRPLDFQRFQSVYTSNTTSFSSELCFDTIPEHLGAVTSARVIE